MSPETLPETTTPHTPGSLTGGDIDEIAAGIEHFIMNGDAEVDAIWQPYVDKLKSQRATLAAAPDLLAALKAMLFAPATRNERRLVDAADAAIAKAEGRS